MAMPSALGIVPQVVATEKCYNHTGYCVLTHPRLHLPCPPLVDFSPIGSSRVTCTIQ